MSQTSDRDVQVETVTDTAGTTPETSPGTSPGTSTAAEHDRGTRKVRERLVLSVKHALYGKVLRRTSKLKAHDEQNQCGVGDRVQIMETRPLSATKRWRVVEIVERAK